MKEEGEGSDQNSLFQIIWRKLQTKSKGNAKGFR